MDDLFLKIIKREIPADIFYEDDMCVAFMDKFPIQPGHFLVVPKVRSKNITEADDKTAAHLINIGRKLGKERFLDKGIPGFKLVFNTGATAEQTIWHTHLHVIPYREKSQNETVKKLV